MHITPLSFNNYRNINKNNFKKSNTVQKSVSFEGNLTNYDKIKYKRIFTTIDDTLDISKIVSKALYADCLTPLDKKDTSYPIMKESVRKDGNVLYSMIKKDKNYHINIGINSIAYFVTGHHSGYSLNIEYNIKDRTIKTDENNATDFNELDSLSTLEEMWGRIKEFERENGNIKSYQETKSSGTVNLEEENKELRQRIAVLEEENQKLRAKIKELQQ